MARTKWHELGEEERQAVIDQLPEKIEKMSGPGPITARLSEGKTVVVHFHPFEQTIWEKKKRKGARIHVFAPMPPPPEKIEQAQAQ